MTVEITCRVAATADSIKLPAAELLLDGRTITEYFNIGSEGVIKLHVEYSTDKLIGRSMLDEAELNVALGDLTGNTSTPGLVTRIGLLIGGRYRGHEQALGYMFDGGFTSDDAGSVPREGCAVFVDSIADLRKDPDSFATELTFTAIHELGHVFNLWHHDAEKNLMARSPREAPFAPPFAWLSSHQDFLKQCSSAKEVHPGGTDFGERGTLGPADRNSENTPSSFGLELRVDMSQREFFAFEPVELEVELRTAPGVMRRFEVPDTVDPAYPQFDIWIEQPNEERRRYRPTKRFCTSPGTLSVGRSSPFRRDISLFGGARGYTFRHSGIHRVWARFAVPGVGLLTSNTIEVNVLPSLAGERAQLFERVLRHSRFSRFLYYRSFPLHDTGPIQVLRDSFADEPSTAAAIYAQGRALLRDAERSSDRGAVRQKRSAGLEHLARAVDHIGLSDHRRTVACRLLRGRRRAEREQRTGI